MFECPWVFHLPLATLNVSGKPTTVFWWCVIDKGVIPVYSARGWAHDLVAVVPKVFVGSGPSKSLVSVDTLLA